MVAFKIFVLFINFSNAVNLETYRNVLVSSYERQEWDKFFGISIAYRKYAYKTNPDNNLVVLEALGLIKHCQFQDAKKILSQLNTENAKRVSDFISNIKVYQVKTNGEEFHKSILDSNVWKKRNDNVDVMSMRSHVENICTK